MWRLQTGMEVLQPCPQANSQLFSIQCSMPIAKGPMTRLVDPWAGQVHCLSIQPLQVVRMFTIRDVLKQLFLV